ncbi:MAG: TonB-dependent receptor, partial [Sulfuricurvum sp.]|nr:TonB-dependent receptor [Sulfuricurvum sp.]
GDSAANYRKNERLSRLSYENRFGDALTTLYANRSTFDRDYSTGSTFDGEINEYGVHSRIGYHENDFIVIGGDYKTFEHRNSINREYDNRAVFITNTNILTTGTVVTESLRRDAFDAFIDKTTGKIGFKHPWSEKGYVSANYGTAYNVPTLYQLYVPTYGNTALKPEETRSYDLTVGYSGISLTYFESHIKEMIDFDLTSWVYSNVEGTSKIKGIEAVFKQELGSEALVSLGYTRLNAKNQRGESLGRRAKANLKFGLDYYGIPKAHIGLNGEYVGSRYDNDNDKGAQTGRYTVASLVADYAYTKHLKIYAKVDNITDKYYQSVNNYASSPRAWYAGMEVSF